MQAARNYHALLAARAVARLAGVLPDHLASPPCLSARLAVAKLLTPSIAALLAKPDPTQLLTLLNSSVRSPQVNCPSNFLVSRSSYSHYENFLTRLSAFPNPQSLGLI